MTQSDVYANPSRSTADGIPCVEAAMMAHAEEAIVAWMEMAL